jgi:osmoprotectant transport system ATP-binding protein
VVAPTASLQDALDTMLVSSAGAAIVTGRRGEFAGVITVEVIMDAITRARESAAEVAEDAPIGLNTEAIAVVSGDPS